ncbi:hypothetical protein [Undibacterium sp. Xuan67W]|uniref:hypothetical protein n=1 Tax=Undibacterium sp. Xuan67W TaxID=3413057 RepID=UPI003BF2C6C5
MSKHSRDQMIFGATLVNRFPRSLWYSTFVLVVFLIVMNGINLPNIIAAKAGYTGSIPMFTLDVLPGYSPAYLAEVLGAYGEQGRRAYATSLMTLDMLFPISYGIFFALFVRRVYKNLTLAVGLVNMMIAMPLLSMVLDWIENSTFVYLISLYPIQPVEVAHFVSAITTIKISLYILTIISLVFGLVFMNFPAFTIQI